MINPLFAMSGSNLLIGIPVAGAMILALTKKPWSCGEIKAEGIVQ